MRFQQVPSIAEIYSRFYGHRYICSIDQHKCLFLEINEIKLFNDSIMSANYTDFMYIHITVMKVLYLNKFTYVFVYTIFFKSMIFL